MRRSIKTMLVIPAIAALVAVGAVAPAHAYATLGYKWATSTIKLSAPAPLLSYPAWSAGKMAWNGLDATFSLNAAGVSQLAATNESRGNTVAWSGVTRKSGTVQDFPTCISGKWTTGRMQVVLNWSIVSGYTAAKRNGVAAHELGHAFGLAHTTASTARLMCPYDTRTVTTPSSDDKAGVNALY